MPCNKPCSAVLAFGFDTALAAPGELPLEPKSAINLLKAAFRLATFLFADTSGAPAEVLALLLLFSAFTRDSSLFRMPPWPWTCP